MTRTLLSCPRCGVGIHAIVPSCRETYSCPECGVPIDFAATDADAAELRRVLGVLTERLKECQWAGRFPLADDCSIMAVCPSCDQIDYQGHKPSCELANALAEAERVK